MGRGLKMIENKIMDILTKKRMLIMYEIYELYIHNKCKVKVSEVVKNYEKNYDGKRESVVYEFIRILEDLELVKSEKQGRIKYLTEINIDVFGYCYELIKNLKEEIIYKN